MKRFLLATLFLVGCSTHFILYAQQTSTDMTGLIVNNSFEKNGLAGWDFSGFWPQTNTATTSQGWRKTGNVYAESWVALPGAVSDGWIKQKIDNLEDGMYTVKVHAHAVIEGDANANVNGVNLNVGQKSITVTKGQEYSAWAIVLNGYIKFGITVNATNANWVACDNFRIYKSDYSDEQVAEYAKLIYDKAVDDTLNTVRQVYFNHDQMHEATLLYTSAGDNTAQLLQSVKALECAVERFDSIKTAYLKLRTEANDFYTEVNRTGFAATDSIRIIRSNITRYYRRDEDHYDWVLQALQALEQFRMAYDSFNHLGRSINAARTQLLRTGYEGADEFKAVIDEMVRKRLLTYDIDEFKIMEENLTKAQQDYLKNRPSEWVTFINGNMLEERNGTVQAHAPGFVRVGDLWYMVGEDRTRSPDVNLYSSIDLVHWNFEKKIIENGKTSTALGTTRMIERPKLLYNPKTEQFVVWCHWEQGDYGASEAACFFSNEVNGEYQMAFAGRPLGIKSRDCNVFVDDDGTAYFISTTEDNNHIGLFQLSDDYLSVVSHTQLFAWQGREAPAVVKIGNIYYMFSSACSGWEPNQCKLATSYNLKSGWSELRNIGNDIAFDTQPAAILTVKGTTSTTYLYVGDRWQDPGLPESKTIIFPITFNGTQCNFNYRERFDINFLTGQWRETPTEDLFLNKSGWNIVDYSSEETQSENGRVANLIDNKKETIWHTHYTGTVTSPPHSVTIDLGKDADITGFLAVPRTDAIVSGLIRQCTVSVSEDGEKWHSVYSSGWLPYYTAINIEQRAARFIRLTSNDSFISLAELDVLGKYSDADGIDETVDNNADNIIKTEYYTIDGRRINSPADNGITICVKHYQQGKTESFKIIR